MSLSRFRLVTFDITNTLLKFRTSPGKQYGDIGALFGVRCDNDDLAKNFKVNWIKMNKTHPNFGRMDDRMDWQQWWCELIANTFADSGATIPEHKLQNFTSHLVELYKTTICWQNANGSIDFLNYISRDLPKETNKPKPALGVIANFDPRLDTLLRNMKITKYFDFVLTSYDCRVEKPAPEIFQMAMEASKLEGLKTDECLHIGDGPTTDYLGAKGAGWHSVLIHEKSFKYLLDKYGDKMQESHVFPSLYDFHKKLLTDSVQW